MTRVWYTRCCRRLEPTLESELRLTVGDLLNLQPHKTAVRIMKWQTSQFVSPIRQLPASRDHEERAATSAPA